VRKLVAFGSGLLFAVGLVVGGMTQPKKIVDFLDFAGSWDPSLAFVMGGALLVNAAAYWWTRDRTTPIVEQEFHIPSRSDIDWRLVTGAGLFGVGWGFGGYCPGPGITAVVSAKLPAVGFLGGLIGGVLLYSLFDRATDPSVGATPDRVQPNVD